MTGGTPTERAGVAAEVVAGAAGDVAVALAEVAGVGSYFALAADDGAAGTVPVAELPFDRLTARAQRGMGTDEARVAASTVHLGLAARLWSPVVGCALRYGLVPDLTGVRYRAADGTPVLPAPRAGGVPVHGLADAVYESVVRGALRPLHEAVHRHVKVADGLLWGNAAAALMGALHVLVAADPAASRPARRLADDLLSRDPLRGRGRFTGTGLAFRRASCCLYYRVPGGGLCGDCPLDRRPTSPLGSPPVDPGGKDP